MSDEDKSREKLEKAFGPAISDANLSDAAILEVVKLARENYAKIMEERAKRDAVNPDGSTLSRDFEEGSLPPPPPPPPSPAAGCGAPYDVEVSGFISEALPTPAPQLITKEM